MRICTQELCASLVTQLFEMGSMVEVKARNRAVLFAISQVCKVVSRKCMEAKSRHATAL
jgi:hypothetical protein